MKLAIKYRPRNKRDGLPWVVRQGHTTQARCATLALAYGVVVAYLLELERLRGTW